MKRPTLSFCSSCTFRSFFIFLVIVVLILSYHPNESWAESKEQIPETPEQKAYKEIIQRLNHLESARKPKVIRPSEEIDYLYDLTIYSKSSDDNLGMSFDKNIYLDDIVYGVRRSKLIKDYLVKNGKMDESEHIDKMEPMTTGILWHRYKFQDEVSIANSTGGVSKKILVDLHDPEFLKIKLEAIEKHLQISHKPSCDENSSTFDCDTLITRINKIHNEVNDKDWNYDNIRFGILVHPVLAVNSFDSGESYGIATSLIISAYPEYRRFIPGINSPENNNRKMSTFFGFGTISSPARKDIAGGSILTIGVSSDIQAGFALSGGISAISISKQNGDIDFKYAFTIGVTLSSELWRALFINNN